MIGDISLASVAATYGGVLLLPDCRPAGLSIDSRTLGANDLFVALKGAQADGHAFVDQAVGRGAAGLILERPARHLRAPQWIVEDTRLALGQFAREVRRASSARVVGITGSTGKTTVKNMVAGILSRCGPVLATQGNLNNELGVPLTLTRLTAAHRFAVIEMGAAQLGDISYLGEMVVPDVALVNNVGVAHLERFGSRGNILRAKGEIYQSLSADGTAVINLDTTGADYFCTIAGQRQLLFSMRPDCGAQVWVEGIELQAHGSSFELCTAQARTGVRLQLLGQANVENALAAAAVALALGVDMDVIAAGLAAVTPVPGRLTPRVGCQGATLLDDSYNANPVSVQAAIRTLCQLPGRAVLVLGNMGELGAEAPSLHAEIGEFARSQGVDELLCIGDLAAGACRAFGAGARAFENLDELAQYAQQHMSAQDVWLVKGSRSAGLDRLVDKITQSEGSTCSSG